MKITFPYYDIILNLPAGTTIAEACHAAGIKLNTACGGTGICGKCLVMIRSQGVTAQVMACQQTISEGMAVLISPDHREEKLLTESMTLEPFAPDPIVRCFPIAREALISEAEEQRQTLFDILQDWLPVELQSPKLTIKRKLNDLFVSNQPLVNLFTAYDHHSHAWIITDLSESDHPAEAYAIACDMGTTSIATYLIDLDDGLMVDSDGALNGQTHYGDDVITRLAYANQGEEQTQKLQTAILQTIKESILTLCHKNNVDPQDIHGGMFCGNTAMSHLCLGLNPHGLSHKPFIASDHEPCTLFAKDLDLPIAPKAPLFLLPNLGGFVGSDTTAVLLNLPDDEKVRLVIDLGTNGEIALGNNNGWTLTSAACGPAFEGGGLTMGMRSATGAIDKVKWDGENFHCHIMDDEKAIGICGSGMMDAVTCLLDANLLQKDGSFLSIEAFKKHPLSERFYENEQGVIVFTLMTADENDGDPIIITQKDIRTFQLALGAIRTGWEMLLKISGTDLSTLDSIILSGAFGSNVDLTNAQKIGLLPNISNVPVKTLGNGAGAGVQRLLLNKSEWDKIQKIKKAARTINLAEQPEFEMYFMMNLTF